MRCRLRVPETFAVKRSLRLDEKEGLSDLDWPV